MTQESGKDEFWKHIRGYVISLVLTLLLGSLFSCSIYKFLLGSEFRFAKGLAEAIKNVFGNSGICYVEDPQTCESFKAPKPSREKVFSAISQLRKLEKRQTLSIDLQNCPYRAIGTFENSNRYYALSVEKTIGILNEYQKGNSNLTVRLIVKNNTSNRRLILKPLPIDEIVPELINSIDREYYTTD
ncbi:hypothetical protein [Microcoleus sp. CAWBG640]|uniref:hypothetical protein n=1 Tax=Microcoleus sp. CAWBG640 TaxID=2841653 RepID=UPI00312B3707